MFAMAAFAFAIAVVATNHYDHQTVLVPQYAHACWSEVNEQMPGGYERICGDVAKAPSDAREFGDRP